MPLIYDGSSPKTEDWLFQEKSAIDAWHNQQEKPLNKILRTTLELGLLICEGVEQDVTKFRMISMERTNFPAYSEFNHDSVLVYNPDDFQPRTLYINKPFDSERDIAEPTYDLIDIPRVLQRPMIVPESDANAEITVRMLRQYFIGKTYLRNPESETYLRMQHPDPIRYGKKSFVNLYVRDNGKVSSLLLPMAESELSIFDDF